MTTFLTSDQWTRVFATMKSELEKHPFLLEQGLEKPIYYFHAKPLRDESAHFGLEIKEGKVYYYFEGNWFSNSTLELVRDPRVAAKEMNTLCSSLYCNYSPHDKFAQELLDRFSENLGKAVNSYPTRETYAKSLKSSLSIEHILNSS